jgi:cyclophilin family peptidyl-prolyl cis-trans isomerase
MNKYTIFGQVVNGQDAAERIQVGDKILKITVLE